MGVQSPSTHATHDVVYDYKGYRCVCQPHEPCSNNFFSASDILILQGYISMFELNLPMRYCTKCGVQFQGDSMYCENCTKRTQGTSDVNSENESTIVQKMIGIEPLIKTLSDPENRKYVIIGCVVFLLLALILPTQTTSDESDDEIRIRWTNVQNCDFSIVLDSGDGRMYNKWVDSWDSVWWIPEEPN